MRKFALKLRNSTLALALALFLSFPAGAFAHSGRTDAQGGHYCRTNCEKWGYEYGTYHYHSKKPEQPKQAKTAAKDKAKSAARQPSSPSEPLKPSP